MTLQEETDLLKSVTDLKALINGIDGRLKKLEAVGPPDYEQNRRTRFQENGSWARLKRKDMPDGGTGRGDENNPFHPRQDVASWILALLTLFYGVLLVCLGDIRVWPPYFVLTSSSLMKSAACAVPVCVVVMGLVAILLTALQAAFSKASAP